MSHATRPRLRIVLEYTQARLLGEVARMLADVARQDGYETQVVGDGDGSILQADAVLLLQNRTEFPATEQLLRAAGQDRPPTLLWHLAPLPRPGVARLHIDAGRRTVRRLGRMRRLATVLRGRVPSGLRRFVGKRLHRAIRRPVERRSERGIDPEQVRYRSPTRQLERLSWIDTGVRDGWLDHVLVAGPVRVQTLAEIGVRSHFVPVGYHPDMGQNLGGPRDIDVVFLGSLGGRRRAVGEQLRGALSERGLSVRWVEGGCHGEARAALLNRTKISLNLKSVDWELPLMRATLSMACGALVVCEPFAEETPFGVGEHLLMADLDEMPDAVARYARDDEAREAIVGRAERLITSELTLSRSFQRMREVWDADPAIPSRHH